MKNINLCIICCEAEALNKSDLCEFCLLDQQDEENKTSFMGGE